MRNPNEIRTYHGIDMDPFAAKEQQINIKDIAHALSLLCRANGHISRFYSVAQHCLNCEKEAEARGYSKRVRMFCLLHDATECYISDVTRPVKRRFPLYYEAEENLAQVIYKSLVGFLPDELEKKLVGEVDDCLLYYEFLSLCGVSFFDNEPKLCGDLKFDFEDFDLVKQRFINRYNSLLSELEAENHG